MPAAMPAMKGTRSGQLVKHGLTGKLVSGRSKTGNPECSQAMSDWKTSGMTSAIAAILGKCRAMAGAAKKGVMQRAAGHEAKAQALEHRARTGKVGAARGPEAVAAAKARLAAERLKRSRKAPPLPEHDPITAGRKQAVERQAFQERMKAPSRSFKLTPSTPAQREASRATAEAIGARHEAETGARHATTTEARDVLFKQAGEKYRVAQEKLKAARAEGKASVQSAEAPKAAPTLREIAAAKRAERGLTPEQRKARAATLYSWWAAGSPTRQMPSIAKRQLEASEMIGKMEKEHLPTIKQAIAEARARVEQIRAKRETPTLALTEHGPKLTAREYDIWGQYQGTKKVASQEERLYHFDPDWRLRAVRGKSSWDILDVQFLEGHVKLKEAQGLGNHPDIKSLRDEIREYKRIGATKSLVPPQSVKAKVAKVKGTKAPVAPPAVGSTSTVKAQSAAPLAPPEFAKRAMAAAASVGPEGRFGPNKVYIHKAHEAFLREPSNPRLSLEEFKGHLATANRLRHLDLSRADMVEAMNREDVVKAHMPYLGANYHFIRSEPATPKPVRERAKHVAESLAALKEARAKGELPKGRGGVEKAAFKLGGHQLASKIHEAGKSAVPLLATDLLGRPIPIDLAAMRRAERRALGAEFVRSRR